MLHFEDYVNENDKLNERAIAPSMQTMATTKSPQQYGQDPNLRNDYQAIVDTFKNLNHPKVKELLYNWIKKTFTKSKSPSTSQDTSQDAPQSPQMGYSTSDTYGGGMPSYSVNTAMNNRQLGAFKGATTKMRNRF